MRKDGYILVWAIVVILILTTLGIIVVFAANASARSAADTVGQNLADVQADNDLAYASRLLAANASALARTSTPSAPALSPQAVTLALQAALDTLCNRGGPGRVRIHVTPTACGQPLPAGATLPAATLVGSGQVGARVNVPFVIVGQGRSGDATRTHLRAGLLSFTANAGAISSYALYSGADLNLVSAAVDVTGPLFVSGTLTLPANTAFATSAEVSGCPVPAATCHGDTPVTVNGVRYTQMQLTDSLNDLPGLNAGAQGELIVPSTTVTARLTGSLVRLTVLPDNTQQVSVCTSATACTLYSLSASGLQSNTTGAFVTPFAGVIELPGNVTVQQDDPATPASVQPLTILAQGNLSVAGNLTLADPPCTSQQCSRSASPAVIGLVARGNVTLSQNSTVDAAISASGQVIGAPGALVRGSVAASGGVTGPLTVQHDPRLAVPAQVAPPGLPALAWGAHQVSVHFN